MFIGIKAVFPEGAVWAQSSLLFGNVEQGHAVQGVGREDGGGGLAVVLRDVPLLVAGDEGRGPPVGVERVDAIRASSARAEPVVAGDTVGGPALEGLVFAWKPTIAMGSLIITLIYSQAIWH